LEPQILKHYFLWWPVNVSQGDVKWTALNSELRITIIQATRIIITIWGRKSECNASMEPATRLVTYGLPIKPLKMGITFYRKGTNNKYLIKTRKQQKER
jgi:hypothetical protein